MRRKRSISDAWFLYDRERQTGGERQRERQTKSVRKGKRKKQKLSRKQQDHITIYAYHALEKVLNLSKTNVHHQQTGKNGTNFFIHVLHF